MTNRWADGDTGSADVDSLDAERRHLDGFVPAEAPDRRLPQGILTGIGSFAVIVAAFVASALPVGEAAMRYAVLAVTVFFFTAVTGRWAAPAVVALIGYLVFDGFLINRMGELSWNGRDDLARILTLVAAVIFGRLIGDSYRLYRLFVQAQAERRAAIDPMASKQLLKENGHHA